MYRLCIASFEPKLLEKDDLAILGTKCKDDFDRNCKMRGIGSCTVEFLPTDDPEARLYRADIIGYLVGYAHRILNAVSFDFHEVDF